MSFVVWFLVFVVLRIADRQLPWILGFSVTYAIAAYVVLPRVVRMGLKILQRKSIPGFTTTGDGLPGDPVNIVLIGTAMSFAPLSGRPAGRQPIGWGWRAPGE